ncbi:MAG: hypothetical protein WBM13_08315 [Bacteroidia bacterium]
MEPEPLEEKQYHYLLDLYDTPNSKVLYEFVKFSNIWVEQTTLYHTTPKSGQAYKLYLIVAPDVLKKYQDLLESIKQSLKEKLWNFFQLNIQNFEIRPDYNKFKIIDNSYIAQITPWEEINKDQTELLRLLKNATTTIDYQSVGLASRSIIQKVADIVFNPTKHIAPKDIDVSYDKYKNRLHTYILSELGGSQDNEIKQFAESIIESCEKAIKLANTVTHDLKASSLMAESSVIGVLTILDIIKLIEKK